MAEVTLDALRARLGEVADLGGALSLLHWDQEVCMPPKGAEARAEQLSTLSGLRHRAATDPALGDLLHGLAAKRDALDPDDARLVDEALYDYEQATKLPEDFVRTFARETSQAYELWRGARERSDFNAFRPSLERLVGLSRQRADYLGYTDTPYDALLNEYERGMTTAAVAEVFATLAREQSALVGRIVDAGSGPDDGWTKQRWDADRQWALTLRVVRDLGFDFEAGRQDRSVHPFTINFDVHDVRLTTRVAEDELFSALTGSIHEAGHGLYEQGLRPEDRRTPLGESISLGIHESQSRMWENMIGRSRAFWQHYTPVLRETFPGQLDGIGPEQVYAAVNRVAPTFIRVEADECTYNLHIILRFEVEKALIEGDLAAGDVPDVWNAKVKDYLGLDVPDDARGCLQDIHWSHGSFGYFPTYALGNLYAAQMMERIRADLPDLDAQVAAGRFGTLLDWLRQKVHRVGRRRLAPELIEDITGEPLRPEPYLTYLKSKFEPLYGV